MRRYFEFERHGTSYRKETLAGITTFLTMAYIIIVNPAILEAAGIPKGPSMVATILSAAFGTVVMGLYARRPFAIAPYMGENAFIAFTVVKVMGYSWQAALGAVFIAGIEEGGRTGFTSLVVAFLFLLSLFFAPLLTAVPPHAYGAALIVIGSFMIAPVTKIDFQDPTELIPAFLTITLISFTYNIG